MVGTTANSPDTDELAVVPFLAGRLNLEPLSRGNPEPQTLRKIYSISILNLRPYSEDIVKIADPTQKI